jgi:hypothetical protein
MDYIVIDDGNLLAEGDIRRNVEHAELLYFIEEESESVD